ncbi:hypothetical protein YC2023_056022 [Brassica napus]
MKISLQTSIDNLRMPHQLLLPRSATIFIGDLIYSLSCGTLSEGTPEQVTLVEIQA